MKGLTILACLLVLVRWNLGQAQISPPSNDPTQEEYVCNATSGCKSPPIGDLIIGRLVYASSTCGVDGKERYCTPDQPNVCDFCDSSDDELRHSVDLLPDSHDLRTWWQSKPGVENVELRVDFGGMFHLNHITMTWKSPRPRCMVIERSVDYGVTWHAYRHFAQDCEECFGVKESIGPVPFDKRGNTSIYPASCTSQYASEQGEVAFVPDDALFQHEISNLFAKVVQNVRRLTNLRIRFTKFQMKNGDVSGDSAVSERYYYALYNLIIKGSCFCYGHADHCVPVDDDSVFQPTTADSPVYSKCLCQHNTETEDCGQCKPLFNDQKFRPGELDEPNPCQECQCHGFAESCHYDSARFTETNETSGGVCDACTHRRRGPNCEQCIPEHYFDMYSTLDDPNACKACMCLSAGVTPEFCIQDGGDAGKCLCKASVEGEACQECKPGFFNMEATNPDGCTECGCDINGTVAGSERCNRVTGQCMCKENAVGRRCDQCRDGFSQLSANDPLGCGSCMCDIGGSLRAQCDQQTRQCPCRPNVQGQHCDRVADGHFFSSIQHLYTLEAETGQTGSGGQKVANGSASLGRWVQLPVGGSVELDITDVKWTMQYAIAIAQTGSEPDMPDSGLKISIVPFGDPDPSSNTGDGPPSDSDPGVIECENKPHGTDGITADMPSGGASDLMLFDTPVCLRKGQTYHLRITHEGTSGSSAMIYVDTVSLLPIGSSVFRSIVNDFVADKCSMLRGGALQSAQSDVCERHEFSLSAVFNGGATACDCNPVGSTNTTCNPYNGQCDCLPGVTGRRCDTCQAYHFGFSSTGCEACNCSEAGSFSPVCIQFDGQCPCLINTVGRTCDRCSDNHYPALDFQLGIGCEPCECNAKGSENLQCEKNESLTEGHECHCKPGVTGVLCDRCMPNFWNFGADGCEPCNCSSAGALSLQCDLQSGECSPKTFVTGLKADQCKPGYMYLQEANPDGCIACFCNGHSPDCGASTQYESALVQSQLDDTDSDGWMASVPGSLMPPAVINMLPILVDAGGSVTFIAPPKYLGDLRTAFSQKLSFLLNPDVRMKSHRVMVSLERHVPPRRTLQFTIAKTDNGGNSSSSLFDVRLLPHGWVVASSFRSPQANGKDLRETLAALSALKITVAVNASATSDRPHPVVLDYVGLQFATHRTSPDSPCHPPGNGNGNGNGASPDDGSVSCNGAAGGAESGAGSAPWVEQCTCPMGYQGSTCQECAPGYTRESSSGGEFEPCEQCPGLCSLLSTGYCDRETGHCVGCSNFTTGPYCLHCLPLHYQQVIFEGCMECPCPGNGMQFADSCDANGDSGATCSCLEGHIGDNCAECAPGFYGQPLVSGQRCRACSCNNNTEPGESDFCDRETGQCLNCLHNTGGATCGVCADGYHGDAIRRTCRPCGCHGNGSDSSVCNPTTGQCPCHDNVVNRRCDECAPVHYGIASGQGCLACGCCSAGSVSEECDQITGECDCKSGIEGRQCCRCQNEFWKFPDADSPAQMGCTACACSVGGATSPVCDMVTGACDCKSSSTGNKCDSCSAGTYGQPDCYHCGQCFDNWNTTVVGVSQRIRELTDRANFIRESGATGTYNATFQEIQQELTFVRRFLDGSYLNETLVETVELEVRRLVDWFGKMQSDIMLLQRLIDQNSKQPGITLRPFEFLNVGPLGEIEMQLTILTATVGSIKRPVTSVNIVRADTSLSTSNNLKERAMTLNLPVFGVGQTFSEALEHIEEVNASLSSDPYESLYSGNVDILRDLTARYQQAMHDIGGLDKAICGSDSRDDADSCVPGSPCGGLRCAVCVTSDNSCPSAGANATRATQLAERTLAAVEVRNQNIQTLVDSIALLGRTSADTDTSVAAVHASTTALATNSSQTRQSAVVLLSRLQAEASGASSKREALQSILDTLRNSLMTDDDSAKMSELVDSIIQSLDGIAQSEVEQIMADTEQALATATGLYRNATAVDAEAHAALVDALRLEGILQQARVFHSQVSSLLDQVNTTTTEIEESQSETSAVLARIHDLNRQSLSDLQLVVDAMNAAETIYGQTLSRLEAVKMSQEGVQQEANEVGKLTEDLESQASDAVVLLEGQETSVMNTLTRSQRLLNDTTDIQMEMHSYLTRAETVLNRTSSHPQALNRFDSTMITLAQQLNAAAESIARKSQFQTTCQFPEAGIP